MHKTAHAGRTLTQLDFARLNKPDLGPLPDALDEALAFADLVDSREVPPDVVTMNSQFIIRMTDSGQQREITLCYPADAAPAAGRVSVYSPVGAALLGLRVGERARWSTPNGDACEADIVAVLFQPEASGEYAR